MLPDGSTMVSYLGALPLAAVVLAERCIVAAGHDDWPAAAVLGQVDDILRQRPGLGVLPAEADELRATVEMIGRQALPAPPSPRLSYGCCRCWRPTSAP
jgi:hypothetical protein